MKDETTEQHDIKCKELELGKKSESKMGFEPAYDPHLQLLRPESSEQCLSGDNVRSLIR